MSQDGARKVGKSRLQGFSLYAKSKEGSFELDSDMISSFFLERFLWLQFKFY